MKHSTTKFEPFMLMYGRQALTPLDLLLESTESVEMKEAVFEKQVMRRTFELIDKLEPSLQLAKRYIE